MVNSLKKAGICILFLFSILSCKKSKNEVESISSNRIDTNLLVGTWKLTSNSNYYSMYFGADHRLMQNHGVSSAAYNIAGYWKWLDGGELDFAGSMLPVSAKIVKLTTDSLVLFAFNTNFRHKRIETENDPYGVKTLVGTGYTYTSDLPTKPLEIGLGAYDVIEDSKGNLYIADGYNDRIKLLDKTTNLVTTFLKITKPINIAFDKNEDLIITGDNKVVRYSLATKTTTILATGELLTEAAVDKNNDIYYIQNFIHTTELRRIDHITGISSPVTGFRYHTAPAPLSQVSSVLSLASDKDGNIYLATAGSLSGGGGESAIWKYTVDDHMVRYITGNMVNSSLGDGKIASEASLQRPISVAVDKDDNVYIGDYNKIRKIDAKTKIITRIAGTLNSTTMSGDWTNATWADLSLIRGLMVNPKGDVIFSDAVNLRIKKLYLK